MNNERVQEAFCAVGLAHRLADIDRLARPSLRLLTTIAAEPPVGLSKFGGLPELLQRMRWPKRIRLRQSIVAKIRLAEVHPCDLEWILPRSSMLWFFYDAQQETYGSEPGDLGSWFVVYVDGDLRDLQP